MTPSSVAAPPGHRPYIGLRYFEERDAHLFYGRDEHVAELLARLAEKRFVAVLGSSGCGKSSLVRAGLLPELRSGMIPAAGARWKVVEFRPGSAPLAELADALESTLGVKTARELVNEGPLGIARVVAEAKLEERTNVLVVADQFEEVFRFQREESIQGRGAQAAEQCQALARRLLDAADQTELPIYVLLVMRSDYLGDCAQFADLPERMSNSLYLVPRLRRDQLEEAIVAPVGGAIDSAVVQRLLSEVGSNSDQLPRMQHLLGRMWDLAGGGALTMGHYNAAGRWEKGLEQHLNKVYGGLSEPQKIACRRAFLLLCEVDKGRAVRRRSTPEELIAVCGTAVLDVAEKCRAEGFLAPQTSPVDIAHECILREWALLRSWIETEQRDAKRLRDLADAAKDAGWRPELGDNQEKTVRGLAGLTLRNLLVWRGDAKPNEAWARRYLTNVDFQTVDGYLTWSKNRDRQQKRRSKRRIRIREAIAGVLLIGLTVAMILVWNSSKTSKRALAASSYREATVQFARGDTSAALAFLAKSLRLDGTNAGARAMTFDLIMRSRWARTVVAHEAAVGAVAWSPDGTRFISASSDNTARVWDARSGEPLGVLRHQARVYAVAWSPDGMRVATGSYDNSARIWDARSFQSSTEPLQHEGRVYAVAWSPDGRRLLTGSADSTARIWNAENGGLLVQLPHNDGIFSAAWSPDGERVATGSFDSTAVIWDSRSGMAVHRLRHDGAVLSVAWNSDGTRLATGSQDGTARIWNADTGLSPVSPLQHESVVAVVAWSPDGENLASASFDGKARIWSVDSGTQIHAPLQHEARVYTLAWSPDGARLITGSNDRTARIWDLTTDRPIGPALQHGGGVDGIAWSPDGSAVLTGSFDGTARVWDARFAQSAGTPVPNNLRGAAMNPDGTRLATGFGNGVQVWDTRSGKAVGPTLQHAGGPVNAVAWSPDGLRLATSSEENVQVWEAASGKPLGGLLQHSGFFKGVTWSPDSTRLATVFGESAQVWDADSGQLVGPPLEHRRLINALAWSPDSARIATASDDETAQIWDARSGNPDGGPLPHQDKVVDVAWSPDGSRIATASADTTGRIWSVASGQPIGEPLQHQDRVDAIAWSPDSALVGTASSDNSARIWDGRSGHAIAPLQHAAMVNGIAWHADGIRVLTVSDKTARLWDARSGQSIGLPLLHPNLVFAVAWNPDGRRFVTLSIDFMTRIWDVPSGSENEAARLADIAELFGNLRLNDSDTLEPRADWVTRSSRLAQLRGSVAAAPLGENSLDSLLRWFFADPDTRTVSPFSSMTPDEYVLRLLSSEQPGARREAELMFPGHPMLRDTPR